MCMIYFFKVLYSSSLAIFFSKISDHVNHIEVPRDFYTPKAILWYCFTIGLFKIQISGPFDGIQIR